MMPDNILVQVRNVEVQFQQHTVLQDVSLKMQRDEIITLIGPNGAGKSTLVRVMLGLLTPHKGSVFRQPNMRVGYMPQRLTIDPILPLTVKRFLTLGSLKKTAIIQHVLTEVGAEHLFKRPIQSLSGGEMQRVLLARALLREPDLLVLDEPIQGVDVTGQYELYELIAQIRKQRGCGILMVSHDLHLVMAATDCVVCLNQKVCCLGHPKTVVQDPAYLKLFGPRAARDLAIYTHSHEQ
jgi:zinc transport system ATP-binding protein